jgi:hypothetical protein
MSARSPHCTWKWCTRLLLALLAVDRSLAHVHSHVRVHSDDQHDAHHHDHDISERDLRAGAGGEPSKCGTPDLTLKERAAEEAMFKTWLKLGGDRKLQAAGAIVVPVCFHVIRPDEDTVEPVIDTASLQAQLDALNLAFSSGSCCDVALYWW